MPSGQWQGSYLTPDGTRVSIGTFPRKAECRDCLNEVSESLRKGTWIDPRQSARTVADVANLWLASDLTKSPNTLATDRNDVEIHIIPAIGHLTLDQVTRMTIEKVVKAWTMGTGARKAGARSAKGRPAPRTVRRRYATLQAIFNCAVDHRWKAQSPCPPTKQAKVPKVTARTPTRRFDLSDDQVRAIADAMDENYRPMVWVAALTGLRWSECAALRVNDFDLEVGTLTVDEAIIRGGRGTGPVASDPKSVASGRPRPIPPTLVKMIQGVIPSCGLTDDQALLFPGPSGRPMDDRWFRSRRWYPALKTVGLFDTKPHRPGFHDLRRGFSTLAIHGGVDVKTLQGLLGHSDSRTTLNLYTQATTDSDRAASDVVALRLLPVPA